MINDQVIKHYNLGIGFYEQGKFEKTIFHLKKALSIDPNYLPVYWPLYLAHRQACLWNTKIDTHNQEDPWTSLVKDEDPVKNLAMAKTWSKRFKTDFFHHLPRHHKKIRLGYLSGDFREHPIGQMIGSMFAHHNRSQFEVFAYAYGQINNQSWGADKFIDISKLNDQQAANKVFADQIDILIDLTGPTKGHRLGICALRPAPIQVTYLGFPGTSGASFFDYVIVDKIVVPKDQTKYYSEKLLYLPHCYQMNNDKLILSDKKFKRSDFGLPKDGFVFASFNQPYKLDSEMWNVWMDILKKIPNSVLWLWQWSVDASNNLRSEAKKVGVDPTRLIFSNNLPKEEHLKRLQLADLGLDTRIYGGHTTTSDMLWAGVPVITILGKHFASRVCASILTEAKVPELICKDFISYANLACDLAAHPFKMKALKTKLTQAKLKTNLFNTARRVLDLEEAYKKL